MKLNKTIALSLLTAVFCLGLCEPSFAASTSSGGSTNILSIFQTIDNQIRLCASVVMGILWAVAGFKVANRGQTVEENSKLILGGAMIGAGGWLASLLV